MTKLKEVSIEKSELKAKLITTDNAKSITGGRIVGDFPCGEYHLSNILP